jgi:hypothetical protein
VRLPLLIAAGALAATHVVGVLFARPLFRPAEVLALLCLLLCCRSWGQRAAVAVLAVGAALTVPPPAGDGAGLQFFSPEQYDGAVRQARLESMIPVLAVLVFILILVATAARGSRPPLVTAAAGIGVALVIAGYVALRVAVVSAAAGPGALDAVVLMPLLAALAALALAVLTAARRQWLATAGATLFTAAAVIWIDGAIGGVEMAYAVRDAAMPFALNLIPPTDTFPQPTPALTAALHLTAAVLVVAGLTRVRRQAPEVLRPPAP